MVRIGLFCVFTPLALVELLFYHHFGIILVGSLYLVLAMQADWAANRLLTRGLHPEGEDLHGQASARLKKRHWSEDDPVEEDESELRVQRLGARRVSEDATWAPPPPSPAPAAAPAPAPAPVAARTVRASRQHDPAGLHVFRSTSGEARRRRLPSEPNFRGRAHEVLGVDENARTRTIVNAFRHWIKRFHPDHATEIPAHLANAKVQQLTDARDLLLTRRRSRKAA